MSVEIPKAIVARWNAAGLDTSLGALHPGSVATSESLRYMQSASRQSSSVFGGLPESTLPRYEYIIDFSDLYAEASHARVQIVPVRFLAWTQTALKAWQDIDTIQSKFVDAEVASTSPLSIDSTVGHILAVRYDTKTAIRVDRAVWMGVLQVQVEWLEAKVTPS